MKLEKLKELTFSEIVSIASDNETETETLSQIIKLCMEKDSYDDIDEELDEEGVDEIFAEIALNPNATADILRLLSNYNNWLVRQNIAYNINATADILAELAEDEEELVQLAVAENDETPSNVLDALSNSYDEKIRTAVAHNTNTASQTLYNMASESSEDCGLVFEEIALNANSDTETLSLLAEDEYRYIHKGISKTQTEAIYESIKNNKNSSQETVKKSEEWLESFSKYLYGKE